MKKIGPMLLISLFSLTMSSCESTGERFRRIESVEPEVDYGYISINSSAITKNFEHMYFQGECARILKTQATSISYPYQTVQTENYIYFLIEYNNRNGNFFVLNPKDNKYQFDIALFRLDIYEQSLDKIYDFKNVYPFSRYNYTMPNLFYFIDDQSMVFYYNGKVEIFSLTSLEVIHSLDIHDSKAYVNIENNPYRVNSYGDCYAIKDDVLHYYENVGETFVPRQFIATGSFYASRYDDYILLHNYASQPTYQFAYQLSTGEEVDIDVVLAYRESIEEPVLIPEYDFLLNDIAYDFTLDYGVLVIEQHEGSLSYTIEKEYMLAHSPTYRTLTEVFSTKTDTPPILNYICVNENKLFLEFCTDEFLVHNVNYIFEYDLVNQTVKYVGYHYNNRPAFVIPLID